MPPDTTPVQLGLFDDPPAAAPATPAASGRPVASPPVAPPALAPAASPPPAIAFPAPPQSRHGVRLGEHQLAYRLKRARRRSIGFYVGPDGLTVSAPRWVGQGEIDAALREKAAWILRKLHEQHERARRLEATRIDWRDGGSLPYLGETLVLVLDPRISGALLGGADAAALPGVARLALHVGLPHGAAPEQVREVVQSWLQRQALRLFEERCALFAARLQVRVARLALSSASTRWGSASADGSIRLNWRLIHFALPVIDYVVTHELAHLREMNHSAAFWDVVRSVIPDYEQPRGVLREQLLPQL